MNAGQKAGWRTFLRAEDLVWLLMFSALAVVSPTRGTEEIEVLAALLVLQVASVRVRALQSRKANVAMIGLKLLLGFLLIGVTGGIASSYSLILLLPVVSAATTLGALGTALVTLLACAAYLAFVPLAYNLGYMLEWEYLRDLSLRVLFLPVVAFMTHTLAEANRLAAIRAQQTADLLAEANLRLREAEESARRSERLAALGQLTAGLAHELRNPLGTMKASAEMLRGRQDSGDALGAELAGYIVSEVDRANSLVTRFLEFARPLQLRRSPTDLNALMDRASGQVVRADAALAATIHKNYDPGIPLVAVDAELLERVVINLLQNAIQASPAGATVTLKTRLSGAEAELAVIDRGCGVKPEIKEQIFNPFFTTKPDGVGLGLAISARIVGEHCGRLSVESEPKNGSIFMISLPLTTRSEGPAESPAVTSGM